MPTYRTFSRLGRALRFSIPTISLASVFALILVGNSPVVGRLQDLTRGFLAAPPPGPTAGDRLIPDSTLACVEEIRLRRGQAPQLALHEAGFTPDQASSLLSALGSLVNLRTIRPSDCLRIYRKRDGEVTRLDYQRHPEEVVVVEPAGEAYEARLEALPVERWVRHLAGEVRGNLYESLIAAGGTPDLVMNYSDLFAWSFDFLTDTRNGDRFELLVEERRVDGEQVGFGRLLGGRYHPSGGGTPLEAFYFESAGAEEGYYDAKGGSVQRQFLKSPLNYRRISSHFSHSRMHPILKRARPHLGVDYSAAAGTPVVALGNGKVTFAGWINGFGKTIKVKHNGAYLTQYAHLSRLARGIRSGTRVKQGDVIGYVGSTGLATGPHLDFRVQENGRWINPLALKGGQAEPLPASARPAFAELAARYADLLEGIAPGTALAWDQAMDPGGPRTAAVQLDTPPGS